MCWLIFSSEEIHEGQSKHLFTFVEIMELVSILYVCVIVWHH